MIERNIARQYRGRWLQGYVRGKLRSDPAYAATYELLRDSDLPVIDVGCGIGLLPFYLRERGITVPLRGFDYDEKKIVHARRAAWDYAPAPVFDARDVEDFPTTEGNVVILDVLHYLDQAKQQRLLALAADHVAPGGMCIIRETPRDGSWRFKVTQLEEVFLHASRWMKGGSNYFPTKEEITEPFTQRGFASEVRPLWGRTPFNSYLFVFRR